MPEHVVVFKSGESTITFECRIEESKCTLSLPENPPIAELRTLLRECSAQLGYFQFLHNQAKDELRKATKNAKDVRRHVKAEIKESRGKLSASDLEDAIEDDDRVRAAENAQEEAQKALDNVAAAITSLEKKFITLRSMRSLKEKEIDLQNQAGRRSGGVMQY